MDESRDFKNGALCIFVAYKSKEECLVCKERVSVTKDCDMKKDIMILNTARNTLHWKDIFEVTTELKAKLRCQPSVLFCNGRQQDENSLRFTYIITERMEDAIDG
jgi:hypothetical protein